MTATAHPVPSEPAVSENNGWFPKTPTNVRSTTQRTHASDEVFHALAGAVLRKELAPGSSLPPERELSHRFGVSRIVVREAVHRLKEYGLVRVRQGSPTRILDPDAATDIRLLGLEIELMGPEDGGLQMLGERQMFAGAAVLDLAEQRMSREEIDALECVVDDFIAAPDKEAVRLVFERDFWVRMAAGSGNRIYLRETRWWFGLLQKDARYRAGLFGEPLRRARLYKALLAAQRKRSGSAQLYLRALRSEGSAWARLAG
jgi:DNA-binding FadR family transcriptional regulator